MKGLFLKDFRYMLTQKNFIILILIIGLAINLTMGDSYYFALGYVTFLGVILGVTTSSMDDQKSGMSFLFTLPISRKQYVTEKYLFSVLMMLLFCGIGLMVVFLTRWIKHYDTPFSDIIFTAFGCFVCLFFFLGLMLPLTLKFGEEHSRLAYFITLGAFLIVMIPMVALINFLNTQSALLLSLHFGIISLAITGCLLVVLCLIVSYCVSLRIINHRDF